jgi:hypothetical protein
MRKDVYVSNDSGGMSILSRSVLQRVIDDGRENDGAFVRAQEAILGSLVGDDSFIARVVVSEPLRPEEEQEWIAHYRWALKVPCGKLLVAGELAMYHEEDPGHESEWDRLAASVDKGTLDVETDPLDWIGFLIHLQPFAASAALTEPEEGDWFAAAQGLRRPKTFPLGVSSAEAKDPEYREALSALVGDEEDGGEGDADEA